MNQDTTNPTITQAFQQIVTDLERRAAEYAEAHSNKLRRMTEAHRRERFIDWFDFGEDEPLNQLLAAHFEMIGEREPDEMTEDEYREIIGIHYDRLTDEERAEIERQIRQDDPQFYFDDDYYSDEMIEARNRWSADIRELVSRARDRLYDQYALELSALETEVEWEQAHKDCERAGAEIARIATQYQPVSFNCDACGADARSHDETGALIAGVGVWALSDGRAIPYIICEACAAKPTEAHEKLGQHFAEWEAAEREAERQEYEELQKLLAGSRQAATSANSTSGTVGQNSGNSGAQGGPQSQPSGATPIFVPLSAAQLIARPPKQWLVERVIGVGDAMEIYGPSNEGKTFVVLDFIIHACNGRKWAGMFDVARPLTIAYCASEGHAGMQDRIRVAMEVTGLDLPADRFYYFEDVIQLYDSSSEMSVDQFIKDWKASGRSMLDIIIIDTFQDATIGADENSGKDASKVRGSVKKLRKELCCAVGLVHHTNAAGERERGHSSYRGDFETMIKITGSNKMELTKLKDGAKWQPLTFSIIDKPPSAYVYWDGLTASSKTQTEEDKIYRVLQGQPGTRFTAGQIEAQTGIPRSTAARILGTLTNKGLIIHETVKKGSRDVSVWYFDLP